MRSVLSFSWSRRVFSRAFSLSRRTTSLSSRRSSVRSDLTVSFWSGEGSRTVRRRGGAGHGPVAPSRAFDAARALRSRAFSLRSAPAVSKADAMPASERSVSRRATSACKDGTALAVRRASFVSSTASLSLRRQALNRDFHEPPSLRAATSAQRSSSARASAASARARSRSHCDRQSRGACSGTDTGDNRTPPLPSTSVRLVPKSSSRTTMRTTIAHGKSRYQQKDSTLWGLASTWEMRLTGPIPRPERTLTFCGRVGGALLRPALHRPERARLTHSDTKYQPAMHSRYIGALLARPLFLVSASAPQFGALLVRHRRFDRIRPCHRASLCSHRTSSPLPTSNPWGTGVSVRLAVRMSGSMPATVELGCQIRGLSSPRHSLLQAR